MSSLDTIDSNDQAGEGGDSLCNRETCSLSKSFSCEQFVVPIRISSASEEVNARTDPALL